MKNDTSWIAIPLVCLLGLSSASAQQRVEFQRQKFDRSRFERPGQPAAPAAAPVESGPAAAGFAAPDAPMATPAAPAPMVTQSSAGSIFSTNAPSGGAASAWGSSSTSAPAAIFSADAPALSGPPPVTYPAGITPEEKAAYDAPLFDEIPAKWFNNPKDHAEILALQKKTGACLLIYFKNFAVPNEKGLCSWFEKSITTDIKWRKAMKYYVKLEISVPGNSAVEELVALYRANKTPAVFVLKPGATMPTRLKLFDYPAGSRPVPIEAEVVLAALKTGSTPAYQPLF